MHSVFTLLPIANGRFISVVIRLIITFTFVVLFLTLVLTGWRRHSKIIIVVLVTSTKRRQLTVAVEGYRMRVAGDGGRAVLILGKHIVFDGFAILELNDVLWPYGADDDVVATLGLEH
ncbi:hypothetical protein HSBAA_21850 [Vreelandella sulfidaeris]|uniref:Uncharacterized protein n=1 Tax=Vreelandella sulfidaeris TaxID=115553 RepID=A0A455U7S3_9GAMM|nr:hypothetical protein HSBAA_21850 [Halomonas sulfidaeris]